jgi:UTP--glucose-1-phosphate uridylyltransferase
MNSFATDTATRTHLEEKRFFELENSALMSCVQGVSLRLSERGDVVCDAQGEPSLYAPGHGDLPWALESSGVAAKLRARGVETLFVSNVDNLGCTLDPAILGAHLEAKNPISVECCTRTAADSGGAPVYVDDTPQLLEGFRLPQGFDESSLSAFNTNTFYFSWSALRAESFARLAFYPVAKVVDGRSVVQFERILGELTRFSPTTYLRVPRDAETGRFLPVKAPEDLARLEATLAARYRSP